jgi:tRNA threonylcarbamoyladenosine biosynthesis protein TsaE
MPTAWKPKSRAQSLMRAANSSMSLDIKLPDPAATEALGRALSSGATPGRVIHLRGDLGAGKTTLARGLLRGLGHAGRVKSPTYTLVEPYELSSLHFYHFDFYRLKNKEEWEEAGLREYFNAQSLCVVEWPERAAGLVSLPDLEVTLAFEDDARRARIDAHTEAGRSWLSSLRY